MARVQRGHDANSANRNGTELRGADTKPTEAPDHAVEVLVILPFKRHTEFRNASKLEIRRNEGVEEKAAV